MRRRALLATGLAGLSAGLTAGCLGLTDDDEDSSDGIGDERTDSPSLPGSAPDASITEAGLASDPEDVPAADVSIDDLETTHQGGEDVPLLPMEHAYDWYRRRDARFVDARSESQYDSGHISGAALSTQPDGLESDDPTAEWATDERIVTFCGCPHSMSGRRSASLMNEGHEAVFVLDEGLGAWEESGYPMDTTDEELAQTRTARSVSGAVDPTYAGGEVRVRHEPTGQHYPDTVARDGTFEVVFEFVGLDSDSPLVVETPAWTQRGTVAELTDETLR